MSPSLTYGFRFEIDRGSFQRIAPPSTGERFEGIDFSPCGNIIAIATSEGNQVLLYKRRPDGAFEDEPFQTIGRSPHALDYPHDISFSRSGLLAVAQRTGAIAIYARSKSGQTYDSEPAFEIGGPRSKLAYSDGIAFVPPKNDYLAACNLQLGAILFFRKISQLPVVFEESPAFELRHPSIFHPDGLAFSRCGRWLATANHGKNSVSVFQRRSPTMSGGTLVYGPEPVTVIRGSDVRYPHSVAFTPQTNHLIVTNAGANYFGVYAPRPYYFGMQWSDSATAQVIAHDEEEFQVANVANKMEGGPKGVAIHGNNLAICSPQIGVKIYSFLERRGWLTRKMQPLKPARLPVDKLTRFDMADQGATDEWHELERHPEHGSFRWTGPGHRATIRLPIALARAVKVRIHILSALGEAINTLKLSIQDKEIAHSLHRLAEGRVLVVAQLGRASMAKVKGDLGITLQIANTGRPRDLGLNQDSRSLGLAVNWIELDPNG
jgi:hypothetical protein